MPVKTIRECDTDDGSWCASESSPKRRHADSLCASFPGRTLAAAFQKMVSKGSDDDDPLSTSCFASIRLGRSSPLDEEDEEEEGSGGRALDSEECDDDGDLTSLAWLQDANLLKSIGGGRGTRFCPSPPLGVCVGRATPDNVDDSDDYNVAEGKENEVFAAADARRLLASTCSVGQQQAPHSHPSHVPYNPQKHVNSKPPYSFSCLIFMAIEDAPEKRLPVKDIYSWILGHFPYFQRAPTGWKNSVRHNLSLNKCFKKVDKDKGLNIGKGSCWCIDPDYRPNLLQALRKTPYHPYHQLQIMSGPMSTVPMKTAPASRLNAATPVPQNLFPFLSRRLSQSGREATTVRDSLSSDIDVANALVSLKSPSFVAPGRHQQEPAGTTRSRSLSPPEFGSEEDRGRKARQQKRRLEAASPVVVTEAPSADHTYTSASTTASQCTNLSPASSSIDGEYEFGSRQNGNDGSCDDDDESELDGEDCDDDDFGYENDGGGMEVERDGDEGTVMISSRRKQVLGKEMEGVDALLNLASIATSVMMENTFREEVVM